MTRMEKESKYLFESKAQIFETTSFRRKPRSTVKDAVAADGADSFMGKKPWQPSSIVLNMTEDAVCVLANLSRTSKVELYQ